MSPWVTSVSTPPVALGRGGGWPYPGEGHQDGDEDGDADADPLGQGTLGLHPIGGPGCLAFIGCWLWAVIPQLVLDAEG